MAATYPPLPRLAFGNVTAQASADLEAFTAAQRSAMPSIRRYEPLRRRQAFRHHAATVRVGDVRLVASASTPVSMAADESTEATLLIPFHGWGTSVIEGREHRWQAGGSAMFLPGSARTGESGVRSVLAISCDLRRLAATARVMLETRDAGRVDLGLQTPQLVPIRDSRSPALASLRHVLSLVDAAGGDPANLRMLGLDDTILRVVVLLLAPHTFGRSAAPGRGSDAMRGLRNATEYIVGHLEEPITLTDLERISGLAARTLQLAFRRAHGCSPREWIRRRRLLVARERLLAATPADTVAAIATACGFTRLASFSAAYARRFGEMPSVTLVRARRR